MDRLVSGVHGVIWILYVLNNKNNRNVHFLGGLLNFSISYVVPMHHIGCNQYDVSV